MQGLQEYSLNPKVHHRRMVWNKIAKRFKGIKKHATGVVLAGPEPVDRECLRNSGFKDYNFIFADSFLENVSTARESGLTGFHGDIFDYLIASAQRIDVLHLDFHCGISLKMCNNIALLWLLGIIDNKSVMYVNLQRGRDEGNRGVFGEDHLEKWKEQVSCLPINKSLLLRSKKRNEIFSIWFIKCIAWWMTNSVAFFDENSLLNDQFDEQVSSKGWQGGLGSMFEFFADHMPSHVRSEFSERMSFFATTAIRFSNPEFNSYKSNVVWMDSVLMNVPALSPMEKSKANKFIAEFRLNNPKLSQKVAAAKAVQTKRQNCRN